MGAVTGNVAMPGVMRSGRSRPGAERAGAAIGRLRRGGVMRSGRSRPGAERAGAEPPWSDSGAAES